MSKIVISLCDFSGIMVKDWAENGYICYCVDIQNGIRKNLIEEYNGGGKIIYTWGDIRSWTPPIDSPIKIIFAFPPCTDLTVAGARDFETKRGYRLSDALELFDACRLIGEYSRSPYMIENPIGRLNSHRSKPDYIFDPCDYGGYLDPICDQYTKKTCLWTGGGFKIPDKKRVDPIEGSKMHKMPPSEERANLRSETPMGFARAVFESNN
jgi:hypothetical protein